MIWLFNPIPNLWLRRYSKYNFCFFSVFSWSFLRKYINSFLFMLRAVSIFIFKYWIHAFDLVLFKFRVILMTDILVLGIFWESYELSSRLITSWPFCL